MIELIAGAAAIGAAVAAMARTLTADLRAKRALAKLARTDISAATDGEWVKIVGTLQRDAIVIDATGRAGIATDALVGFFQERYARVGPAYLDRLVDQKVAVFGWASWEGDAEGDYRGSGKRLVLRGTRRAPVVVTTEARFVET